MDYPRLTPILASAVATKEATDASSVVTQETTLEDSLRNDLAPSLQPLSPSVSPSGNGCREDSNWLPRKAANATAVAIRKARKLANGWRRRLVLHAPNGLPAKAVAGLLGRDYNTLLAEVGERSGHKAGVELLLPIMDTTGSCVPLDVLAEAMGGFFVHMPEVEGDCAALTGQCLASVREFGNLASAVATKEATDASSVVTQETTLEDSLRNDLAPSLQPLSPSVSPSGNGCREDSNCLPRQAFNAATVAIRKARKLANGWRMTSVADALADGKITEEERRTIAEKGYSAQTAILALLRLVDASAVATKEATAEDSNWLPRR